MSRDTSYSWIPYALLTDRRLSLGARLVYCLLEMHGWQHGEVSGTHDVLADEMRCSARMVRTYLAELAEHGEWGQ